ncbi:PREDICTED: uncharacterized protein LOC109216382 [Nicotiana attenuata]|uniref:uncharacterized protein LOC109216382 n=1 Tax=Nicotiana attenuata TaxID=49451 RepID=UPI0009059887|nr:PREDICTED: uncharacterized protein LOC109216382 [Nicotiana attenuata]
MEELNQYEAEIRGLTEKRDAYKHLSEKSEGEGKSLLAKLEVVQKEHADLVQQKLDQIEQLRTEVYTAKAEAKEWKSNMDRLASEKETARAQLSLAEFHLRAVKERALVQAKKIEELQSQPNLAVYDRENLSKELETAKSEAKVIKVDADEMVAVYKADAEAAQVRAKDIIEHAKRQSRREALEKIHAQGFDLSHEIENAKGLKAEAEKLAYLEDDIDSEDLGESEGGGDPERDAAPGED